MKSKVKILVLLIGGLLLTMIAGCGFTPVGVSTPITTLGDRAMWVWGTWDNDTQSYLNIENIIIPHSSESQSFLNFCHSRGIKTLFFQLDARSSIPPNKIARISEFNALLHSNNFKIQVLSGDPNWALTSYHSVAETILTNILNFNKGVGEQYRFDGIHFDIEPHVLSSWNDAGDNSSLWNPYLTLFQNLKNTISSSGTTLTLAADIAPWYCSSEAKVQVNGQPVGDQLIAIVDEVALMSYRDYTQGANGIIDISTAALNYADSQNKKACVGVETQELSLAEAGTSFYEEGYNFMHQELLSAEATFVATHESFSGIAIHHYDSYRTMNP